MDTKIKVAFYILPDDGPKARDLFACRLVEKAYNNNLQVFVNTVSQTEAQNFYDQLWTFRDVSFIPHEIYNLHPNADAPVLIGYNSIPNNHTDVLINLTLEVPRFYDQFKHIIEIVTNDIELKAAGRKRYKYYQEAGCQMETYNI
jgi:DNA polymerase III subunit chi